MAAKALIAISFMLLALLAAYASCAKDSTQPVLKTLEDICSNRNVPLTSVSQVKKLIRKLNKKPKACPDKYQQSLRELDPVLTLENGQRWCDEAKFRQIASYHFRYINPKVETYTRGDDLSNLNHEIQQRPLEADLFDHSVQVDEYDQEVMIPIGLQYFFKAWALQVAGICKRELMENIRRAVQEKMDKQDMGAIGAFFEAGRTVVDPITDKKIERLTFDGVVYMPELEGHTHPELEVLRQETTTLNLKDNPDLHRFFSACKLRYKPIYSQLILPVVRMAKLGYDYMGTNLQNVYGTIERDPDVLAWLGLTAICELRGNFKLVDSETPLDMQEVTYAPTITFDVEDSLWIKGKVQLQKEFDRIKGSRSTGFRKVLYNAGVKGNRLVSFLDPHRSAWYRRNQSTLSSTLNSMSIISNLASICVTVVGASG